MKIDFNGHYLKPDLVDPFFDRLSRKPSSLLPAMSYELLDVLLLLLCVVPFVRLPLRCDRCSVLPLVVVLLLMLLLLLLLLLLLDCPPLIGDAILLLIASAAITEKLRLQPLSSREVGVVLELEQRKERERDSFITHVLVIDVNHSPIIVIIVSRSKVAIATIVEV